MRLVPSSSLYCAAMFLIFFFFYTLFSFFSLSLPLIDALIFVQTRAERRIVSLNNRTRKGSWLLRLDGGALSERPLGDNKRSGCRREKEKERRRKSERACVSRIKKTSAAAGPIAAVSLRHQNCELSIDYTGRPLRRREPFSSLSFFLYSSAFAPSST